MAIPETTPLALAAGLASGAVHVLTGPDHLAAVLPFASSARRRALLMGLAWGVGHAVGVLALGMAVLLLDGLLDLHGVSAGAERFVGFLLIGLGLWTLRRAQLVVVHVHPHVHEEAPAHTHAHVHIADATVGRPEHAEEGQHKRHGHSALAFGLVHGMAGTSHLLGVAPALVLGTTSAVVYLGAFLVGSALSMATFAALAGRVLGGRPRRLRRGLQLSGTFALAVGGYWVLLGA